MKAVAIHTDFPSIRRTLVAMLERGGYAVQHDAAFGLHYTTEGFSWGQGTEWRHSPCPIHPQQLLQHLQQQRHHLGHGWVLRLQERVLEHTSELSVLLTEKESALLAMLLHAYPQRVERASLLHDLWGMRDDTDTHTLETHIYRLRSKLALVSPTPCELLTEEGAYRLHLRDG